LKKIREKKFIGEKKEKKEIKEKK